MCTARPPRVCCCALQLCMQGCSWGGSCIAWSSTPANPDWCAGRESARHGTPAGTVLPANNKTGTRLEPALLLGLQGLRDVVRKHKYQRSCKKHSLESLVLAARGDPPVSDCFAQLLPLQVSCTNVLNVGKPSTPCCVPHGGRGWKYRCAGRSGSHARLQTDASTQKCEHWCAVRTMQRGKGRLVRVCQAQITSSRTEQQLC